MAGTIEGTVGDEVLVISKKTSGGGEKLGTRLGTQGREA
jgi:hypothetical protein